MEWPVYYCISGLLDKIKANKKEYVTPTLTVIVTKIGSHVHVCISLGTPLYEGSVNKIVEKACKEAEIYFKNGVDGILLENMHDVPYIQSKYFGPEVVATLSRIANEIRRIVPKPFPFGIQVLACGNNEAVAIAHACDLNFIRAEGYIFGHIADEGFTDANAGKLLRYRKHIDASDVLVFADIKKKHSTDQSAKGTKTKPSHVITSDVSLIETAKAAEYFKADALVLTGSATGDPANVNDISDVKRNVSLPVVVGSGVTAENVTSYIAADALIIGSYFKTDGQWSSELNEVTRAACATKYFYSTCPQLPPCDFVPNKYEGSSLEKQKKIRQHNLYPALTTYYSSPQAFCQGYKQWLFDYNGRRYLDLFGGICTVSVGHCHPRITEAVSKQMATLGHVSNVYFHPKIHEYAERLIEKLPGNLKVVYFVNSGSEANDLAVLLARSYTNRSDIITIKNSYHGMTCQTMGLTSNAHYKYLVPHQPGIHNVMNPDVYRGIWGGVNCRDSPIQTSRKCSCEPRECEAKEKYVEQVEELFYYNLAKGNLAGFFAESIQGVGGTVQFPKGYIKAAYDRVKEYGGLFVSDEVQTGFGRTGDNFWGFEMHGIVPDIVTMAKGIGNGYPLGAVVTTPEIGRALAKASHFNTYGGNPVASAAGITVLDIIEDERLQENSKDVGTYLLQELAKLKNKYPVVGDVRGKGLMIGVELVDGDGSTKPLSPNKFMEMWECTRDLGLIIGRGGYFGNVLRIKPPMCITKSDADFAVQVLEIALGKITNS